MMTVSEFIAGLMETTDKEEWDTLILPAALAWNRQAYNVSDDVVRSIYQTLKDFDTLTAEQQTRFLEGIKNLNKERYEGGEKRNPPR
jgi:hypothetical protein